MCQEGVGSVGQPQGVCDDSAACTNQHILPCGPAGDFGNEALQAEAAKLVTASGSGSASVPPDLAAVAAQLAVQGGDDGAFAAVKAAYETVHIGGCCSI